VAVTATRRIPDHDHASIQISIADDPRLTVVLTCVFDLERDTCKYKFSIGEIQSTLG